MSSTQYQNLLDDNGVSYVAVPGVTLESEALHEVEVIRQAPYLRLVWTTLTGSSTRCGARRA